MTPLTPRQAAELTGYTLETLYQKVHRREIPFYKPNPHKLVFSKEEIEEYLFSGRVKTTAELERDASLILESMKTRKNKKEVRS